MKLLFGIAVYISNDLHLEFTEKTVQSIQTDHDYEVILINNYCAPEYRERLDLLGKVIPNDVNCVSSAWNKAIDYGRSQKVDYIFCPNNDIIFHPQAVDNLIQFSIDHPEFILWTANQYADLRSIKSAEFGTSFDEHPHFSCWMVKPDFVDILGEKEKNTKEPKPGYFDENFVPAYFEDGDMHNRILRAGFKAGKTASSVFYHFGSRTIKSDDTLNIQNAHTYEQAREYFKKKWGWDPHGVAIEADDPVRFAYKGAFEPGEVQKNG